MVGRKNHSTTSVGESSGDRIKSGWFLTILGSVAPIALIGCVTAFPMAPESILSARSPASWEVCRSQVFKDLAAQGEGEGDAGRELGDWHLNYERVEPYLLTEEKQVMDITPDSFYRVTKMSFGKKDGKPDKTVIIYNPNLILRDIPLDAYGYVVNGKSAIEWIMERYQVTVDKASGIKNDPNDWSEDPRYILDLLRRVVNVSLESVRIVAGLPGLEV